MPHHSSVDGLIREVPFALFTKLTLWRFSKPFRPMFVASGARTWYRGLSCPNSRWRRRSSWVCSRTCSYIARSVVCKGAQGRKFSEFNKSSMATGENRFLPHPMLVQLGLLGGSTSLRDLIVFRNFVIVHYVVLIIRWNRTFERLNRLARFIYVPPCFISFATAIKSE